MDNTELYLRRVDAAVARENFLEKEMLDSDVHHLEVRTGFFDKLAVLGAGSLAVGVSFMTAGGDNDSFRISIHAHLFLVAFAFVLVLLSLILCIIHNSLVSRAVFLLSSQLEEIYKGAHEYRVYRQNVSFNQEPIGSDYQKIADHEKAATGFKVRKDFLVGAAQSIGTAAVALVALGYIAGITDVVLVIYSMR